MSSCARYVRWATLSERDGVFQFEKGSALAGYHQYTSSSQSRTDEDASAADHNPTPSMLWASQGGERFAEKSKVDPPIGRSLSPRHDPHPTMG